MKIYLNNYDFTEIDKSLEYDNKYYNDLIYTPSNILLRENDNFLWKTEILYDNCSTKELNSILFIFDYSELKKTEKIFNIPKEHFHIKEYIFEKEINEQLFFVKKILYDQIIYYFQYKGTLDIDSFSFEELFNFIK
jgi:hypothetical protein